MLFDNVIVYQSFLDCWITMFSTPPPHQFEIWKGNIYLSKALKLPGFKAASIHSCPGG